MMMSSIKLVLVGIVALGVLDVGLNDAEARGGGSNFMNSPGYQRRLQESRGYVTNQSGSLLSRPMVAAPPAHVEKRMRRRR